jgi:hypothetical protein
VNVAFDRPVQDVNCSCRKKTISERMQQQQSTATLEAIEVGRRFSSKPFESSPSHATWRIAHRSLRSCSERTSIDQTQALDAKTCQDQYALTRRDNTPRHACIVRRSIMRLIRKFFIFLTIQCLVLTIELQNGISLTI